MSIKIGWNNKNPILFKNLPRHSTIFIWQHQSQAAVYRPVLVLMTLEIILSAVHTTGLNHSSFGLRFSSFGNWEGFYTRIHYKSLQS